MTLTQTQDDPPQHAKSDSLFSLEELERQTHPPGSRSAAELMRGTPGFASVARREHAIERRALAALQLQEEVERRQMLVGERSKGEG